MKKIVYELPLEPRPLIMDMSVLGQSYRIRTQYRDMDEGGWIMDIESTNDDIKIPVRLEGVPLVAGLDILWQYNYFDFGFSLLVLCEGGRSTPTFYSLGVEDKVVIVVTTSDEDLRLFGISIEETIKPGGWTWPMPRTITVLKPWLLWENFWNDEGVWYDGSVWR